MKISKLKNIIKESIKELVNEQNQLTCYTCINGTIYSTNNFSNTTGPYGPQAPNVNICGQVPITTDVQIPMLQIIIPLSYLIVIQVVFMEMEVLHQDVENVMLQLGLIIIIGYLLGQIVDHLIHLLIQTTLVTTFVKK